MASIIRVKRSTGNSAPASINYGELAVTIANGTQGNKGGRLFVGDNTNPDPDPIVIGGKYYTDMMQNTPGTIAGGANANSGTLANGFIPILERENSGHPGGSASGFGEVSGAVANMPRVNQWNVDNLTLDGNTIASNNVDGDIKFVTNGGGQVIINDDTKLTFGASEDASIEYDEDGTDRVQVTGAGWVYNNVPVEIINPGFGDGLIVDNIGISSNVIRSRSGGGNTLFIDPYPDGLDSDGMVVIKGSLQVDGTTTTVNSTNTSLNDPIMNIGDVTSKRTVLATVGSGTSAIQLDSIVGINTGDTITGAGLPGAGTTTIHSYSETAGISTVFIDGQTTAGIAATTQLTVTHGFDTNTDRGITFNYNTGTGVANNKTGFFGFNDSTGESSNAPERSFTYISDATNTGNVISGTKGFLDIKGIYFQSGDYSTAGNGIIYFDTTGKMVGAAGTTAGITTSNFILTTDASGIPKWTTTIDGGQF